MRSIRTLLLASATAFALTVGGIAPSAGAATQTPTAAPPATSPTAPTAFRHPITAKTYNISSYFGPRCIPLTGASTYHYGVDLAAKAGTPIYAIAAGVVSHAVSGTSSRVGYISVRHSIDGAEYTTIYMHIWSATTRVKVGQKVTAGQRISEVGSSGASSGAHLHLELWKASHSGAKAQDAAAFLQARGVDLLASASAVTARATPATCTYYTVGGVNFRTGPSTAHSIIQMLPKATAMVHVPGSITAGFIPVRVGNKTGWVSAGLVSPVKPAVPAPAVVNPAPRPPTYVTTAALNLRTGTSTSTSRILMIPKGANVGAIQASSGVWRKVTYLGKTGWVHSAYIAQR